MRKPSGGKTMRKPSGGGTMRKASGGGTMRKPSGGETMRKPSGLQDNSETAKDMRRSFEAKKKKQRREKRLGRNEANRESSPYWMES